ncbi:hypothetical protein [Streptomyces sp. NPDC006307]|uniref:hypothetical protein n=1 Tax=Streptomyces sp. NPDC006307 TaxID=3156748 RepID=UPI0033B00F85
MLRRDVRVGVSLDGTTRDRDRNRRFADGRGSHAAVAEGLRALGAVENRHLYAEQAENEWYVQALA